MEIIFKKEKRETNKKIVEEIKENFFRHRKYTLAKDQYTATAHDNFLSVAYTVKDMLIEKWIKTQQTYYDENEKRIYYFSLEFLMGRTLGNSLINLGVFDEFCEAMEDLGLDIEEIRDQEKDAGLGNGGLGRLAACFLDSLATLEFPAYGYGIRYDYGIFNQKIVDGYQVEEPDNWLKLGNPWEIERPEYEMRIKFYGKLVSYKDSNGKRKYKWENTKDVLALPFDIPIPGYRNNTVNTLRLWSAKSTNEFDFHYFNSGDYIQSVEDKNFSENISRVLYPNDETIAGKQLRLKQQYFFVAASLKDIIRRYNKYNKNIKNLHKKVAIQLNDTHPAIAIPELMRILTYDYNLEWKEAWQITTNIFAYTNHTLLPEAMEKWSAQLMEKLLPCHMKIIYMINNEFLNFVSKKYPGDHDRLRRMSIIDEAGERYVRMAYLSIIGSHSVNGVAKLHSDLLKSDLLRDFYEIFPERFNNKTNGITQRRWLLKCNPLLSSLITQKIGDGWTKDLYELKKILKFIDDEEFIKNWQFIKMENKKRLADVIKKEIDVDVNVDSLFDVQIKRLHEYKRQLLNALHIISLYIELKSTPDMDFVPRTFIFGAKAAPGYERAKLIIKLINNIASVINNDKDIKNKIKIVFIPNYRVSLAEKIIPGSDLSEQISTAGKEASGTGNMKFALNGALTIGTYDGANIEILQEVGKENIFIFGLKVSDIEKLKIKGYNPKTYYDKNLRIKEVIDLISCGFFSEDEPELFQPIVDDLLYQDEYMLLADFQDYYNCQKRVSEEFLKKNKWAKKTIKNVANMGLFSSDRTIKEYVEEIWNAKNIHIDM
jgi:starch phosphorylase